MPRRYDPDMADRYSPSVRRRRLGMAMRRHREATGMDLAAGAEALGIKDSTLSKLETADRNLTKPMLLLMFNVYDVPADERADLMDMHVQSRARGWWQDLSVQPGTYVDFEAECIQVQSFDYALVPGLLQTEEYAERVIAVTRPDATATEREGWKQVRVKRAELLTDPDGPRVWSVIHESALATRVGSAALMAAQVRRIADLALSARRLDVQVLPFDAGEYAAMEGSFALLSFEDLPQLGYVEHLTSAVWLEKQRDINTLGHAFGKVISQSLSPKDSVKWLQEHAARLESESNGS